MAMIPSDPNNLESEAKYSLQHIKLIQSASEKQNKSSTEILLDEWGTSGKVRPTISTLLEILKKAEFFRAAEYVAVDLLKEEPPTRPSHGPAAVVDIPSTDEISKELELRDILHFPYSALEEVTNNFDETPFIKCIHNDGNIHFMGHRLGTGAFGTVYYGTLKSGQAVAVKKLAEKVENLKNQFENEIRTLSEYHHFNLVPLLGFSCDTENYCLVYEFMSNGSLLDKLQLKNVSISLCDSKDANKVLNGMASNCGSPSAGLTDKPLTWEQRMRIAVEVSEGIHFLHTSKKFPLIHRDVKSANILLDDKLTAKLGDFGLVKVKPNLSESKMLTSTIFGTSAYMAPEAFRGDVSVKMDVFSFGVVLLELLTGLPPYDESREGFDLVTYIEDVTDNNSIGFLLDKKAGNWDLNVAEETFKVAQACLEEKKSRLFIDEVRRKLKSLRNIDYSEA